MADGRVVIDAIFNGKKAEQGFNGLRRSMESTGQKLTSIGQGMTAGVTLPIIAAGAAAVATGMKFDSSMSQVAAVTGATGKELQRMEDLAKDMGKTTKFSASEAADAMGFLGMAGFDTTQIMKTLPNVLDLATAGNLDLARAADISSNILTGFGLKAKDMGRVTDVMAKTASSANTNIEQLGNAMSYVAPVAASAGWSIEETSAAIGIMSNAGIQGEKAGTALRGIISSLISPTGQTADALKELGLSAADVNPQTKSLADILKTLESAGLDTSSAMKLVGVEAGPALLAMMKEGSGGLNQFTGSLKKSNGAAKEMAQTMADNAGGDMKSFLSALEGVALAFYEQLEPAIRSGVQFLRDLASTISNTNPTILMIVAALAAVAAAAGPLLIVIGSVATIFTALSGAAAALGIGLLPLIGIIAGVVAAIAAIIAIGVALWMNWDVVRAKAVEIWSSISQFFATVWASIRGIFLAVAGSLINWLIQKYQLAKTSIIAIWQGMALFFSGIWQVIKNIFIGALLLLMDILTGDFEGMRQHAIAIFGNIKEGLRIAWQGIRAIFNAALKWLVGLVGGDFNAMRGRISAVMNRVRSILSSVWAFIKSTFKNALAFLKALVTGDFNGMRRAISRQMSNIRTNLGAAWSKIKSLARDAGAAMLSYARSKFESMRRAIRDRMNSVRSAVHSGWNRAKSYLQNINLRQIGRDIIRGLINGISSMAGVLARKASNLANSIKNKFKSALRISSPSKVFEQYGKWTGEGYVRGIDKEQRHVNASIQGMTAGVQGAVAAPQMQGANTSININFTGPVNMRSREDIDALARQLETHIRRTNRGITRGVFT
ncbi:phage tail tape measure protein [Salinithrix halophila]|uniref:Phage tail tape measure protein n=1 Tax=Salinithrix halophila TaxID=1485204 RepID=A0ABV8JD29_9BACL